VAFHVPTPNSFVSLSVAAGATERVRLISTIVALPLYPAVLVAKLGAALDAASGGRYEMGIGIGGEYAEEFAACGVPLNERGARSDEALEVIRRCWTERNVAFDGRFNHFGDVTIQPAPLQHPHPPIWVAGRRQAAMRRAARFADGWLPYMYTPEMLAESVESIDAYREAYGRRAGTFRFGLFISAACHPDGAVARRYASERLGNQYAQDFSARIARYSLAGTPAECRDRLAEYLHAGARYVVLASACPDEYFDTNERLLAEEVVASFQGVQAPG
jgi:probable F420-dependent oxidoreductase